MTAVDSKAHPPLRWQSRKPAGQVPLSRLLPLMRAAVAAAPQRIALRRDLAAALFAADRMTELVDRFGPAAGGEACDRDIQYYVGRAALAVGEHQVAVDALRSAAGHGHAHAFTYLADALLRLHRDDEAVAAALKGLEDPASDFKPLLSLAQVFLQRNEAGRLLDLCAGLRARGGVSGYLPAVTAVAAAMLGRSDEVDAI